MISHIKTTAVFGITAVTLGAFAAHGLKPHMDMAQLETFKTGSLYHFIHTLAMLMVAVGYKFWDDRNQSVLHQSFWMFCVGIILFSGSLYILSTRHLLGGDVWNFVGPITPIGGVFFILGWANLLRVK